VKQLLQNVRTGALELAEVPAPAVGPGQVLVRNAFSVMSPGTEKLALDFARSSLLGKARSRPDLVKQVLGKLRRDGPLATVRAVASRLEGPQPLGYSCAGLVVETGAGVAGFAAGDAVACAGAGYASHAELVVVPENLVARVPQGVSLRDAAFATLGAIALQGIRIATPSLGETVAVVGLGLIGQLTVQLARANGCRVLAIDLDPARVEKARTLGAEWAALATDELSRWRDAAAAGHGADAVIVTASARDGAPLALAAELCRHRGRIALVGAVPIEAERRLLYEKELELRMSMSYGPGRYDRRYEEEGLDYPIAYVRWTENRNLQAFLELVRSGGIALEPLGTDDVAFEEALRVYEELAAGSQRSLAAVFRYADAPKTERALPLRSARAAKRGEIGVAFVGAGNYAKSVLLPALPTGLVRRALVAATGPSASATGRRFGFETCGTDVDVALQDPNVDLVVVATRHDSHADLAARSLRAGKAVWLEKPPALGEEQLQTLDAALRETTGFLTVGYNRRFSKHARAIKDHFAGRGGPIVIHYVVSAGPPPRGSWVVDPQLGGGRIVGEVCHFVDLCTFLVGSLPVSAFARAVGRDPAVDDSTVAVLGFGDGSTATIEYLAHASSGVPKERFEVSGDDRTARCESFRRTELFSRGGSQHVRSTGQDKGQAEALSATVSALRAGTPAPIPWADLAAVSRATFAIEASMRLAREIRIDRSEPL
jgi:predicted dehydrogenase